MRLLVPMLLLSGCSSAEITVSPQWFHWEEIDFQQPRPDGGYQAQELSIRNDAGRDLDLSIVGLDEEHLFLGAMLVDESPPTLSPLAPGSRHVLTVAVWDYLPGERDTLVHGAFDLTAPGLKEPVTIDWSFIPTRVIVEDSDR